MSADTLIIAESYFASIERGATGGALAAFFTPDVVQEEFPNRLNPNGARRDLAAILESAVRGQAIVRRQRFEILSSVVDGEHLALEVQWSGVLGVSVAGLAAGATMRARFAVFLDMRGGKIARQRNYDCFDPW